MGGIEATRQTIGKGIGTKVIGLSMHWDGRHVRGMLDAAASGYVLKDRAPEELVDAIHAVMLGQSYPSAAAADLLAEDHGE